MALNNKTGVSTTTRRMVIKAAQDKGYDFSRIKEKQERLGSVHVVFYRTHNAILSYAPIFDELYDGIRSVCQKSHVIWALPLLFDLYISSSTLSRVCITPSSGRYLVTPILTYREDIDTLQNMVRLLRKAGGFTNGTCGIHIHLDGEPHTPRSIVNFINLVASRNDLFYKELSQKEKKKA